MIDQAQRGMLVALAREARQAAHCPYSRFAVGAALLTADGRSFSACNVENASYGLSLCAERSAIAAAVAAGMRGGGMLALAVCGGPLSTDTASGTDCDSAAGAPSAAGSPGARRVASPMGLPVTPCGACRQVIAEFAAPDCMVLCATADGGPASVSVGSGGGEGLESEPAGAVREYSAAELLPHAFRL